MAAHEGRCPHGRGAEMLSSAGGATCRPCMSAFIRNFVVTTSLLPFGLTFKVYATVIFISKASTRNISGFYSKIIIGLVCIVERSHCVLLGKVGFQWLKAWFVSASS